MKKLKYGCLIITVMISLVCAILACYMAFSMPSHTEARIIQYLGMFVTVDEYSIPFIKETVAPYTVSFIAIFVLMLVTFLLSTATLIFCIKKERPVQERLNAHKETKKQKAAQRKADRIAELEEELDKLKKDGE